METSAPESPATGFPWVAAGVGLVWLALMGFDWYHRFAWFHWQNHIVLQPAEARAVSTAAATTEVPAQRGGDLTRLVGIPAFNRPFEQERPATMDYTDEYGYRNVPPTRDVIYPIVVVGDSYMNSGETITNTFSARLAYHAGQPVYNHAQAGTGPFYSVSRFFREERFRERPPRVLVWGFIEREVAGDVFSGLSYWLRNDPPGEPGRTRTKVIWGEFRPRRLKSELPNTSLLAQAAAKAWNRVRYLAFGEINPDVLEGFDPISGRPLLFYQEAIDSMRWGPETRRIDRVAFHIEDVNGFCRARGIELVIVLIPDKEQVYREQLPKGVVSPDRPLPPSCLYELEQALRQRGITVMNLLDPFREKARAGQLLYWTDDTHWNAEGIDYAARLTWEAIRAAGNAQAGRGAFEQL